jgi:hypothetical protein
MLHDNSLGEFFLHSLASLSPKLLHLTSDLSDMEIMGRFLDTLRGELLW